MMGAVVGSREEALCLELKKPGAQLRKRRGPLLQIQKSSSVSGAHRSINLSSVLTSGASTQHWQAAGRSTMPSLNWCPSLLLLLLLLLSGSQCWMSG